VKSTEIMLKYAQMLVETRGNKKAVYEVLRHAAPIVVVNLLSLMHAYKFATKSAYNALVQNPGSIGLKHGDVDRVMHQIGKNIIEIYLKSPRDTYKAGIKVSPRTIIFHSCIHGYKGFLSKRCGNKFVRCPLMPYRPEDAHNLYDLSDYLYSILTEFIEDNAIHHMLGRQMEQVYRMYIDKWNSGPSIMKMKPVAQVDFGYLHLPVYGDVFLTLYTIHGKKIRMSMRNLNSWVIDGNLTEPYGEVYGILKIEQWRTIIHNPTKWLTLDNYTMLNDEVTHIEEVPQEELGGDGEIRALRIRLEKMSDYEAKYVFFRKCGDEYKFVNANQKDAKQYLQRNELLRRLLG